MLIPLVLAAVIAGVLVLLTGQAAIWIGTILVVIGGIGSYCMRSDTNDGDLGAALLAEAAVLIGLLMLSAEGVLAVYRHVGWH